MQQIHPKGITIRQCRVTRSRNHDLLHQFMRFTIYTHKADPLTNIVVLNIRTAKERRSSVLEKGAQTVSLMQHRGRNHVKPTTKARPHTSNVFSGAESSHRQISVRSCPSRFSPLINIQTDGRTDGPVQTAEWFGLYVPLSTY